MANDTAVPDWLFKLGEGNAPTRLLGMTPGEIATIAGHVLGPLRVNRKGVQPFHAFEALGPLLMAHEKQGVKQGDVSALTNIVGLKGPERLAAIKAAVNEGNLSPDRAGDLLTALTKQQPATANRWINLGSGTMARTNPETGELETQTVDDYVRQTGEIAEARGRGATVGSYTGEGLEARTGAARDVTRARLGEHLSPETTAAKAAQAGAISESRSEGTQVGKAKQFAGETQAEKQASAGKAKSIQSALTMSYRQAAAVNTYATKVDYHFDRLLEIGEQLGDSGIQRVNALVRAGKKEFGDPLSQQWFVQRELASSELAKLAAGGSQSVAQVSEGMRGEMENIMSPGMTLEQLKATITVLKSDAQGTREAAQATIDDGLQQLEQSYAGGGRSATATAQPAHAAKPADDPVIDWADMQ